jgi:hypothetical protein
MQEHRRHVRRQQLRRRLQEHLFRVWQEVESALEAHERLKKLRRSVRGHEEH